MDIGITCTDMVCVEVQILAVLIRQHVKLDSTYGNTVLLPIYDLLTGLELPLLFAYFTVLIPVHEFANRRPIPGCASDPSTPDEERHA